jgi:hypothetical protein
MQARIGYLLCCAVLSIASARALASPSSLDATFGNGSSVVPPQGRIVSKVAAQPDGSTIAVVENWDRIPDEGSVAYIERMLPNGAVDASFGGGTLSFACGPGSSLCAARVSVDKQGRIWIASSVASTEYPATPTSKKPDIGHRVSRNRASVTNFLATFPDFLFDDESSLRHTWPELRDLFLRDEPAFLRAAA